MRRLFYDIETSPNVGLFWEAGWKKQITYQNIIQERAIICISYKWEGEPVQNLRWVKGCDKKLVKKFVKIAHEADELVAHFGDSFDIKWVKARALIHGVDMSPFVRTYDTCKKARSQFKLNSYALNYLGDLLGVGVKIPTNYSMWHKLAVSGLLTKHFDKEYYDVLNEMCDYCDQDVELLEAVFQKMQHVLHHQTHAAVLAGGEKWQCPNCSGRSVKCNKTRTTASGTIKRDMKCLDCRKYYIVSDTVYRKFKDYQEAIKHERRRIKNN